MAFSLRRLNDVKLRDKLLVSFLVLMALPQIVLGVLLVGEFRKTTLEEALTRVESGVDRLQSQTLALLGVAVNLADRIAAARPVETLLTGHYPTALEVFRAYHDFDMFQLYRDVTPEVTGIQVYIDNPDLLDNWEIRPLDDATRASRWYRQALVHPNTNGWLSWKDPTKSSRARLSLVRHMPFGGNHAVLVIDLDTSGLDSFVAEAGLETLVVGEGAVIASSRADLVGQPLVDPRLVTLVASPPGTTDRLYAGQRSTVIVRDVTPETSFNGLRIVGIASPSEVLRSADRMAGLGLAFLGLGAALALGYLWLVYTLVTRRLETLTPLLPQVGAGDFTAQLPVDGRDEIGQLAVQFNAMVTAVRGLLEEVHEAHEARATLERAQGAVRLKMLASQINPHFLFNVLESIRMKAHLGGQTEIASTVRLLGRLMRRNLEASGHSIALEQELENVRCYLEIEKFRLEEKLTYHLDVAPEALGWPVPPLIVEPLVENAVVHGVQRRYGGGSVWVTVRVREALEVEVVDDGVGIPAERQATILQAASDHHVGLANIHQRLLLLYGPDAGLRVESSEAGTRVSYRIPLGAPDA